MLRGIVVILAVAVLLASLLPLLPSRAWWVRAWDFPRLQLALLILLLLAAMPFVASPPGWPETVLAVLLLVALAGHGTLIAPFTPLWRHQVKSAAHAPDDPRGGLRLLVANVLMDNRESTVLAQALERHRPDMVLALEVDAWWVERLTAMLPGHGHRVLHPLDNTYGMALLSRLELIHPEVRFLLDEGIPSIRTRVRLDSGEKLLFLGIHPAPPAPGEADTSLPRDAELVLVGRELAREREPVIVAGDLNDVAWSHTSRLFARLSRLLDPRVGRGFYSTFHAGHRLLRWPLDHIFVSPHFTLRALRRLPAFGSDHFPILADLALTPAAAPAQKPEAADREDHEEASETLDAATRSESAGGASGAQ